MSESKNQSSNQEFLGCIGVIGAALITGSVALLIALPTLAPFFARSTATPIVITATLPEPSNPVVVIVAAAIPILAGAMGYAIIKGVKYLANEWQLNVAEIDERWEILIVSGESSQ